MIEEDIVKLKSKVVCFSCIGEEYLKNEVLMNGARNKCSYCGKHEKSFSIGDMASRVKVSFEVHYIRTANEPDGFELMLCKDKESNYDWEREGEPVDIAIMNAARIRKKAAQDIQKILEHENMDYDASVAGIETEYSDESYYKLREIGVGDWHRKWEYYEQRLKTESRLLSRESAKFLANIFDGIDNLRTTNGQPLVIDAGPKTEFNELYRARVFQSDEKLKAAICRPDTNLGSPPSSLASAGRMNAQGISVFYGANDPSVAIAEVRAPVGSRVAVARFKIIRPLRLLDLRALSDVTISGSIFDIKLASQLERAAFLRLFCRRISRPVMPNYEPFEYLATQSIADYLANENIIEMDGIVYPSIQAKCSSANVVLFHKAARVKPLDIAKGTKIDARTGQLGEEGWEEEYTVIEEVPVVFESNIRNMDTPSHFPYISGRQDTVDSVAESSNVDNRKFSLRVILDSIKVHRVLRVEHETEEFSVSRHTCEEHDEF